MIRRPPRSTLDRSSAASDVYKRQAVAQQLMQRGFIVRAGLRPEWLRITIGHAADNQAIRMILEELL